MALEALAAGETGASERVMSLVYARLRALADRQMRQEPAGHTLQPTALVHEVYLKLIDQREVRWESQGQFFAVAAEAMRRILVDHARTKHRLKRGGAMVRVPLDEAGGSSSGPGLDMVELDEAMNRLAKVDPVGRG